MSGIKETILVLLCWRQTKGEMELLLLGFPVDTRAQRHVMGFKVYPSCPNCNVTQAAPAHILACIGCQKSQTRSSPATVFQYLKTHGFKDLI
ncbi:hypothetical protein TNCV_2066781 [Trichonephila clavipes]|uniref:Uncharacterized protein n=1 Tax=Trichonephila clavipes TaxID=2585209 RepID=A0A8X6W2X2_TRICX|nr:hypothetical protein TNCV_2066781 [Trichonephila clavipes]